MRNHLICLALTFVLSSAHANPVIPVPVKPQQAMSVPSAPALDDVQGFVLMDANSGKLLAEKNADKRMPPASLTKLMTMYVISGALKNGTIHLDDKVRISQKAWQTSGSRMFVKVNDEVPVRDLIQGIVVASGNDASVAMAEYVAGSEDAFASMMNDAAKQIGMQNTHFVDSNGLPDPNHYSTPRDLALLAQAIINDYPEDYKLYSEKWFTYNNIRQPNRNRLLWRYEAADGLKTGHTDEAGYCLVASATKNNTRLISVVMGAPNDKTRTEDSIQLLTYGFRFFETHKLYGANTPLATSRVWKGSQKEVALGLKKDLFVAVPPGQFKNVKATLQVQESIKAPVVKGEAYGAVNVTLNNQVIATEQLVALSDNPKGGMWRNLSDSINYSLHKLFTKSHEQANNG